MRVFLITLVVVALAVSMAEAQRGGGGRGGGRGRGGRGRSGSSESRELTPEERQARAEEKMAEMDAKLEEMRAERDELAALAEPTRREERQLARLERKIERTEQKLARMEDKAAAKECVTGCMNNEICTSDEGTCPGIVDGMSECVRGCLPEAITATEDEAGAADELCGKVVAFANMARACPVDQCEAETADLEGRERKRAMKDCFAANGDDDCLAALDVVSEMKGGRGGRGRGRERGRRGPPSPLKVLGKGIKHACKPRPAGTTPADQLP